MLFLSGMVAMIMMRTLHRDFNRYNAAEVSDDVEEETGWKLVHGDVFRPPKVRMALSMTLHDVTRRSLRDALYVTIRHTTSSHYVTS